MKNLIHSLFFFLLLTEIYFAQWFQQDNVTNVNLNSVFFIDSLRGWIVGDDSTILHTSNGGINWINQFTSYSGYKNNYNDIFFINDSSGWVVSGKDQIYSGIILHTSNGGNDWLIQGPEITRRLNTIFFINDSTGWIGGGAEYPGGKIILKTTNGGINWDTLLIDMYPYTSIFDIKFANDSIGWAVGGIYPGWAGEIFKTTDGGINWSSQLGNSTPLASCDFISDEVGWVTSSGLESVGILNTTNGGITWELQYTPDTLSFESINSIIFINNQKGWTAGSRYLDPLESRILHTDNGGLNWEPQNVSANVELNSIFFIDEYKGWVVGDSGTILHTTNGGQIYTETKTVNKVIQKFVLSQNHPNPFNPSTKIKYSVPQTSQVQIKVFDVLGNEIETLVDQEKQIGTYEIIWYAQQLPSGVYFYQLKAGDYIDTKKMILLK